MRWARYRGLVPRLTSLDQLCPNLDIWVLLLTQSECLDKIAFVGYDQRWTRFLQDRHDSGRRKRWIYRHTDIA